MAALRDKDKAIYRYISNPGSATMEQFTIYKEDVWIFALDIYENKAGYSGVTEFVVDMIIRRQRG